MGDLLSSVFLVCNNLSGCGKQCRLDPTIELIKHSFVLYLQHGRHDVKCKPSIHVHTKALHALLKFVYLIKHLRF